MLKMSLRQVEVFVATARKGNVTQAAATVGLTQSAASMALADFENQIGTKLFDRIGKRLALNEDGRMLYAKAVEFIERAQEMESLFRRQRGAADLQLGASSTIGNYLLPQLIGEFTLLRPGSRIQLKVGNTQEIIDAVRHFEIDIGFVEGSCVDADIDAALWQRDELVICCAPDHRYAQLAAIDAAALAQAGWILRERGSGTREVVEQMLMSQLGEIRLAMELGGTEAIKRAVESGMGISCLPRVAVKGEVERGSLVSLATPFLKLSRPLHILMHKQKYRTEGMAALLALCESRSLQR
jgi:DNA-binding transcriptional LysR family regulator